MKTFLYFSIIVFLLFSGASAQSTQETSNLINDLLNAEELKPDEIKPLTSVYDSILLHCKVEIRDEDDPYEIHSMLFELLHGFYFKKYTESAYLSSLFTKNEFNCLTAVILYQMICWDLNLSIHLYETPYHVYITVPRQGKNDFKIELTDPIDGFDAEQDKSDFIKYLIDYKLVTQEELAEKGEDQIYRESFSETKLLGVDKLSAAYFSNLAYYNYSANKKDKAYKNIKRALLLAPDSTTLEAHNLIWVEHVDNIRFSENQLMSFLLETIDTIPSSEVFQDYMIRASALAIDIFIGKNKFDFADSIYQKLLMVVKKDSIAAEKVNQFHIIIEQNKIRHLSIRGEHQEAFFRAGDLYMANDDQENLLDIFIATGDQWMQNCLTKNDFENPLRITETLIKYAPNMKSVLDNYVFVRINYVMSSGLYKKDPLLSKELLIDTYKKVPENAMLAKAISQIHHELAMAEVRNYNYKKAAKLVNEGLKYAPDDIELKYDLKLINDLIK